MQLMQYLQLFLLSLTELPDTKRNTINSLACYYADFFKKFLHSQSPMYYPSSQGLLISENSGKLEAICDQLFEDLEEAKPVTFEVRMLDRNSENWLKFFI